MRKYQFATLGLCAFGLALFAACESDNLKFDDVDAASNEAALGQGAQQKFPAGKPGNSADAGASNSSPGGSSSLPPSVSMTPTGKLLCGGHACACNNGIDDDGDGKIDGFDGECTGAIDDDESSFATGIPGDNRDPKWQDCFFDGNSGAGDDRCRYPTGCLTGELSQDDAACAVTETCRNNCQPRTPNGCDCFGCCSVKLPGGGSVDVMLKDSCSLEKIGDESACPVCVKSTACGNECGECELCPGKTEADLPEHCHTDPPPATDPPATDPPATDPPASDPPATDPPATTCEGGTACDPDHPCTEMTEFCSMGCCLKVILH
jgi:hypothetical protein